MNNISYIQDIITDGISDTDLLIPDSASVGITFFDLQFCKLDNYYDSILYRIHDNYKKYNTIICNNKHPLIINYFLLKQQYDTFPQSSIPTLSTKTKMLVIDINKSIVYNFFCNDNIDKYTTFDDNTNKVLSELLSILVVADKDGENVLLEENNKYGHNICIQFYDILCSFVIKDNIVYYRPLGKNFYITVSDNYKQVFKPLLILNISNISSNCIDHDNNIYYVLKTDSLQNKIDNRNTYILFYKYDTVYNLQYRPSFGVLYKLEK